MVQDFLGLKLDISFTDKILGCLTKGDYYYSILWNKTNFERNGNTYKQENTY